MGASKLFYAMQNAIKDKVGVNVFDPVKLGGSFTRQVYLPSSYDLGDDEALKHLL